MKSFQPRWIWTNRRITEISRFAINRALHFLFILLTAFGSSGCLSRQVARDGIDLRQAILEMYTDQVMDNLIRAKNDMPFVVFKYSQIQTNDMHDLSGSGTVDQAISTVRNLVIAGATKTVTRDYKEAIAGDCKRTMNFTAEPITDQNDAYQKFIDFARNPNLFMTSNKPPPFRVHIMRKGGHQYYWVPCEAGPVFFDLCMKTTFMRGKDDPVVIPAAYPVKILDVKEGDPPPPGTDAINATMVFDNKKLPNGQATLVVDLKDGRKVHIRLWQLNKKGLGLGDPTDRMDAQWSPKKDDFGIKDLVGQPARLYSHDFPPEVKAPPVVLEQINTSLNSIRVQLQNQPTRR